ncbi:MAG TPA: HAD family hydrolase [Anaerolineae bacterium]|nr:HAD family hydrolase [Anaerolineae bacterium]HIQ06648.1 HAD family hydrolase [Anaerolineae bacterium]
MASDIPAAIFDLDGTLFTGHTWYGVTRHHRSRHINRHWLYVYLAVHMPWWLLYKLGLISQVRARFAWARDMAWTLRGMSQAEGERMFAWMTDEYVLPLLRTDVVDLWRDHQAQGHRIILLSGTFEPLLAVIGQRLGVDAALGTRLELRNGRYTGHALPPVPQGEGKAQRLQEYLDIDGQGLDLNASFAYADSIADLPVLEMVGHPVVVCPEPALADLAAARGWPQIGNVQPGE